MNAAVIVLVVGSLHWHRLVHANVWLDAERRASAHALLRLREP